MTAIEFTTGAEALAYRAQEGGHVFVAEDGGGVWFHHTMTLTPILKHPLLHERSGTVNPREA